MTKLLLVLLCTSITSFATDLTYFDSNRLLNQSLAGKKVSQAIEDKFKPQQAEINNLTSTLKSEESALLKYSQSSQTYAQMSVVEQSKYNGLVNSYQATLSKLKQLTQLYNSQRDIAIKYANIQLNILANGIVKSYALSHNLQAVYRANQFGYVESSFDITDKLLPQLNVADVSGIITEIKAAKVGLPVNSIESR